MHTTKQRISSPPAVRRNFVELVKNDRGAGLHLIQTFDAQHRPCWFLLKANPLQLGKLKQTTGDAIIDLTQFGEVVDSGWGQP